MEVDEKFPNYNLFKYVEGYYQLNKFNSKVYDGIPVIFIPGNAGCYKQGIFSYTFSKFLKQSTFTHGFKIFLVQFKHQK